MILPNFTLVLLVFLILNTSCYIQRGIEDPYAETPKCEEIRVQACKNLAYDITIFPNDMGHATQEEAAHEISQYTPLVRIRCSTSLKLFLCTLYFPVCTGMRKPLPPCRSLCEQNRRDCEPLISSFQFQWPEAMNCDRFPEDLLCIAENKTEKPVPLVPSFICPMHMRVPPSYEFSIRIGNGQVIQDCGIPCDDFLFGDSPSRRFSRLWIGLWSCLCAASTLFTVLTFLIDMSRFQYPERPIIFLSACYLMVSLSYVAGFILKNKVACSGPFPPPQSLVGQLDMPRVITQGTKFEGCIILFMLIYYFSMASSIWWVVLTITWYLAAKCHWAHEGIARNAQYFHFAAWALPAAKTIGLLALGKVDGDPMSGVCFTGLTDPIILRAFLIFPLCLYLVIGSCFLFAGFVSLFQIRTIIKTGGSKTDDLEKLIMRIGIFSLLYIVPALVVICCYFHESRMLDQWILTWYKTEVCRKFDASQVPDDSICSRHVRNLVQAADVTSPEAAKLMSFVRPEFELFMIKYLMTLIVGITSGIWIWSGKTLVSWQHFFARMCRRSSCCCPSKDGDGGASNSRLRSSRNAALQRSNGCNQGSVPLIDRNQAQHHHHSFRPPPPYVFGQQPQDATTTSSGWASRGAPSGVTASVDVGPNVGFMPSGGPVSWMNGGGSADVGSPPAASSNANPAVSGSGGNQGLGLL